VDIHKPIPNARPKKKQLVLVRARRLSVEATMEQDTQNEDLLVDIEALQALASQRPTPLRLKDMHHYACNGDAAQRLRNAQFLHKELPIRMTQRAMDLLTLPHGLNETTHVRNVAVEYLKYIQMFQQMAPPTTQQEETAFTDMLESIVSDRQSIPMAIAQGIASWLDNSANGQINEVTLQEMEDALYRFFTARVGLRFLTEHHILSDPHRNPLPHVSSSANLGCIQTDCDPVQEIRNICEKVSQQTKDCYGVCPEIELVDSSTTNNSGKFTYVPHHLQYMVAELLKNSCRATVDRYYGQTTTTTTTPMPPIRVIVVQGDEDVSIKVADSGGGAPRSTMDKIWKFAHSTSPDLEEHTDFGKDALVGRKVRGFGLPLARIYARYFGGELTLRSMEGHGVDAYLYLPRLGYNCENLPLPVIVSPGEGDSMPSSLGAMVAIIQKV
jgi:pyruvate dehydrogenase kinase 2/3/4